MSNTCKNCGGPTLELLFERVCKAECDIKAKQEAAMKAAPFHDFSGIDRSNVPGFASLYQSTPPTNSGVLQPGTITVPPNAIGPGVTARRWGGAYPFPIYSFDDDEEFAVKNSVCTPLYLSGAAGNVKIYMLVGHGQSAITGLSLRCAASGLLLQPSDVKLVSLEKSVITVGCVSVGSVVNGRLWTA